jgi:carboxyl-terminal processing protease
MKNTFLFALLLMAGIISSCKKEVSVASVQPVTETPVTQPSISDLIKDTSLMVAKELYLWYDMIPAGFDARSFSDPDKIMTGIRKYSLEPGFNEPVDRWSFAYKQQDWDNVSSGVTEDFGLNVFFFGEGDLRVRSVERASAAGRAGVQRGWRISKINGNSNITTANSKFIVDNIYGGNTAAFTFMKPDGNAVDLSLTAATYQEHPIFFDSVYNAGSRKVGYLVFNSFLGDTTEIYNEFRRVFSKFSSEQVTDLVVDLRYNGGGYVSVQEKLANYIVNNAGNGNVMMKQQYNKLLSQYNITDYFRKLGSVDLNRVFFIVSNSTASASELLINNLKPYMEVKLVGPSSTYGKPVGFFPYPVGDWYVFPVSFRSTNKNGEGSYFGGIPVDGKAADGLDRNWGDRGESAFASVMSYITTGSFTSGVARSAIRSKEEISLINAGNSKLEANSFKGAIETRRKFNQVL